MWRALGGSALAAAVFVVAFPASAGLQTTAPLCNGVPATIYVDGGTIVGGPGNGQAYAGTLIGTPKADVMVGTDGPDIINGRGGPDLICGLDGNDKLRGADGNDILIGGPGNDILDGDDGRDGFTGDTGRDTFKGGAGRDASNDFTSGEDTKTSIEAQNAPPVANTDTVAVMEDDPPLTINVRANDSDPNGDPFLVRATTDPLNYGAVAIVGGETAVSYDPDPFFAILGFPPINQHGPDSDSFTYTITDAYGATATATVNVVYWFNADYTALCVPITLSDATVSPGDTITVSATSSWPGAIIKVVLNGTTVLAQTTSGDPDRFWTTPVTIPLNTPSGTSTIQGVQELSLTQPEGCQHIQIAAIEVS